MQINPSLENLKQIDLSEKKIIPVWQEIIADLETPVGAYSKVCKDQKLSFLLESAEKKESFGRYSYIGIDSEFSIKADLTKTYLQKNGETIAEGESPYDMLDAELKKYTPVETGIDYIPSVVGYFSFDSIKHIESKLSEAYKKVEECESFPESYLFMPSSVLVFDHLMHKIYVVKNIFADSKTDLEQEYAKAKSDIQKIIKKLEQPHELNSIRFVDNADYEGKITSNLTKEEWNEAISKAKEYIVEGDIFQVVLSQRFCVDKNVENDFNIYRALRSVNPSPYLYYLNFDDFKVIGSSPEVMVKCSKDGEAYLRPIAGTRPRGLDNVHDEVLEKELLADPKEVAEHIMLVDLGRNDLGRVCEYGSIEVNDFMHVEKYSHVQHIVSDVKGMLKYDLSAIDLLKAVFPAGTVSGAPKIRAMEIIYELEKAARGPYSGCVGCYGYDGSLNTAITIRTMLVKDDKVFVQAGAGIVADSNADNEYAETQAKAAALVQTVAKLEEIK